MCHQGVDPRLAVEGATEDADGCMATRAIHVSAADSGT